MGLSCNAAAGNESQTAARTSARLRLPWRLRQPAARRRSQAPPAFSINQRRRTADGLMPNRRTRWQLQTRVNWRADDTAAGDRADVGR